MNVRPTTPHGAANPLPSSSGQDTPRHKNLAATPPCGPALGYKQYRNEMARDTRGQWVGPIPHKAFFAKHMSVDEPIPENLVAPNYFDKIPAGKGKTEKHMYDPLIELVSDAGLLDPTCILVNTSNHADFDSYVDAQWKPDVTCYLKEDYCEEDTSDEEFLPPNTKGSTKARNPENKTFFDRIQFCIEMKPDNVSPFNDPPTDLHGEALQKFQFENRTGAGTQARGQIGAALTEICARQHRTRAFFVFINAKDVRFLLHDRCATLVTRAVNYRENSGVLAEFFWRFARMTPAQRGIDETVRLATSNEQTLAMDKLKRWAPKKHRPVLVIGVPKPDGKMHEFAVWGAMAEPKTLHGRSTRAYPAVDLETGNVVFLKETWRANLSGMEKESDILKELNDKGVRYVPKFQYGDDIKQPYHTTNNHRYVNAKWRAGPLGDVFRRTHNRFTELFVGNHLDKFTTPKKLITAVSHALIAHRDAYHICGILHRDVSGNNVMMDDDENGCLNDWDLAKRIPHHISNPEAAEEADVARLLDPGPAKESGVQEGMSGEEEREEGEEEEGEEEEGEEEERDEEARQEDEDEEVPGLEELDEGEEDDEDDDAADEEYEEFPRHTYRTGTWYFMSTLLLRLPGKLHDLQDDLESFFYVVLFFTLQYLPVSLSQPELVDFMKSIFEECTLSHSLGIDVGGQAKTSLLAGHITSFTRLQFLDNPPVNSWMRASWLAFEELHRYIDDEKLKVLRAKMSDPAIPSHEVRWPTQTPRLAAHIGLRDHDHFLKIFGDAVASDGWSDTRHTMAAVHQFVDSDPAQQHPGSKRAREGGATSASKRSKYEVVTSRQGGINSSTVPSRQSARQREAEATRKARSLSGAGVARFL